MRKLNIKQKQILDFASGEGVKMSEELPPTIYSQLNLLNCYEDMDSDIDRYLTDKFFEKQNKR